MSKNLTFEYDGKDYTLEFTKKTVEMMERNGFKASDINEKPMTALPTLFSGAFLANHRFVRQDTVNEIYSHITNRMELIGKLAEMYNEPLEQLIEEPKADEGNVTWKASW